MGNRQAAENIRKNKGVSHTLRDELNSFEELQAYFDKLNNVMTLILPRELFPLGKTDRDGVKKFGQKNSIMIITS